MVGSGLALLALSLSLPACSMLVTGAVHAGGSAHCDVLSPCPEERAGLTLIHSDYPGRDRPAGPLASVLPAPGVPRALSSLPSSLDPSQQVGKEGGGELSKPLQRLSVLITSA